MKRMLNIFRRKEKIRNELHKLVIDRYKDTEFQDLDELIKTVNNDKDFQEIVRTFEYHILKCSQGGGTNINYNPEDGLHFYIWDYYSSLTEDKKIPITSSSEVSISLLIKEIIAYCVYADRCYPKAMKNLEYEEKHRVFDMPINIKLG